jgi:uncharacterized protein
MNRRIDMNILYPFIIAGLVIALQWPHDSRAGQEKVSEFGRYRGYSEASYDGVRRTSDYLRLSNGTRLAYTTPPLDKVLEITGHPVVHLRITADAPDLDVFVYLEEVDGSGRSTYITEGNLRASHRKLSAAPFKNLGLPFQSHYKSDVEPLSAEKPAEMIFSLLPTSYRFTKGNRIRITMACADADNFETPVIDPAPRLRLMRNANHPSFIALPVIPLE